MILSFLEDQIIQKIDAVDMESTFIGYFDNYMERLFCLFRTKGGSAGCKIRDSMKLLDQVLFTVCTQDHSVGIRREVVMRCLIVYLSENTESDCTLPG